MSFFSRRRANRDADPLAQPARVGVNVTLTHRDASNDGLDWKPGEHADLAAKIRQHKPTVGTNKPDMGTNLVMARHAAVLKQEAAFLADTSGTVEPPEREALIDALASRPTTSLTGS